MKRSRFGLVAIALLGLLVGSPAARATDGWLVGSGSFNNDANGLDGQYLHGVFDTQVKQTGTTINGSLNIVGFVTDRGSNSDIYHWTFNWALTGGDIQQFLAGADWALTGSYHFVDSTGYVEDGPGAAMYAANAGVWGNGLLQVQVRNGIGFYQLTAADLRFEPAAPSYTVQTLYDSTRAVKSGATLPVKLQVLENGTNVSAAALSVHATSTVRVSTSTSSVVADAGNANPDSDFRYDASLQGYLFNLKTTGLATGTYALHFTIGGSGDFTVPFQVR